MKVQDFLSKPMLKININHYTSIVEHFAKTDKEYAMWLYRHGLGEEVSTQFVKSTRYINQSFDSSGNLNSTGLNQMSNVLASTHLPKNATIGQFLNNIERIEVESKYNYLA